MRGVGGAGNNGGGTRVRSKAKEGGGGARQRAAGPGESWAGGRGRREDDATGPRRTGYEGRCGDGRLIGGWGK